MSGQRWAHLTETPDIIRGEIEYDAELYDEEMVARLATHLEMLLDQVAAAPDIDISTISLVSAEAAF